ncbi:MAG: hypothetical protein L0228_10000 [Planctomycetes bacterium]|nr:hypothetical protein [Planctomycetota bacterium]
MAQPHNRFPLIGLRVIDPGELLATLSAAGQRTDQFWGVANSIRCPVGMEPGSAWFVMDRSAADKIGENDYTTLQWVHEGQQGGEPTQFKKYVQHSNIAIGLDGRSDAPRLVEFRDKRQVLKLSAIDREYNVRRPTRRGDPGTSDLFYTDSLNSGTPWTWQSMLNDVWSNLPAGIRGTAPTLAYTPVSQPENFRFHGRAWDAVGTILAATHSLLVLNPLDDEFTIKRHGDTQADLEQALSALVNAGRKMETDAPTADLNLSVCPEKIRFYFPKRAEHQIQITEREDGGALISPYHTIDKDTNLEGAEPGTVLPYRTRFMAELDYTGGINNATALNTLADELLTKIKERIDRGMERGLDYFMGIVTTIKPGAEIHEMVWRDYGDRVGCVTELHRIPSVPGIGPDTPLALDPRRIDIVRKTSNMRDGGSGYYPAKLLRFDPIAHTLSEVDDIWLEDMNEV